MSVAYVYGQVSEISQKVFEQRQAPQMKFTLNYPLAKPTPILMNDMTLVAEGQAHHPVGEDRCIAGRRRAP